MSPRNSEATGHFSLKVEHVSSPTCERVNFRHEILRKVKTMVSPFQTYHFQISSRHVTATLENPENLGDHRQQRTVSNYALQDCLPVPGSVVK